MALVIKLLGRKHVGKTTTAKYLFDKLMKMGFVPQIVGYADPVRAFVRALGYDPEHKEILTSWTSADIFCASPATNERITVRQLEQIVGLDLLRKQFHPDVLQRTMSRKVETLRPDDALIIHDCRMANEMALEDETKCRTLRFKISRELKETDAHPTEKGVDSVPVSMLDALILNEGTIPDLYKKLDGIFAILGFR